MVVVLAGQLIELPRRTTEVACPVVGVVAPDVPVALCIVARRTAFAEPWMLFGGVIRDKVKNQPKPTLMHLLQQQVEVDQAAEDWIDVAIVRNVISEIRHWRGKDGCNP